MSNSCNGKYITLFWITKPGGDRMYDINSVLKAQKGDDGAFVELMSLSQEELYRIAFTYMKNEQEALDIVSDTVYKAYMGIKKLNNPQFFQTWIIKILINQCINRLKVSNRITYIREYDKIDINDEYVPDIDMEIPRNIDLYKAIDKLDIKSKSIIILRYAQDMTIPQISEVLQIPKGTIKANIYRSLKKLKNELGEGCI